MTCAWIEPHGTVVWCDDGECIHNHVGMCAMDVVDVIDDKCKTKEVSDDNRLSDHQGKAR
jgi:hypothetical protein